MVHIGVAIGNVVKDEEAGTAEPLQVLRDSAFTIATGAQLFQTTPDELDAEGGIEARQQCCAGNRHRTRLHVQEKTRPFETRKDDHEQGQKQRRQHMVVLHVVDFGIEGLACDAQWHGSGQR